MKILYSIFKNKSMTFSTKKCVKNILLISNMCNIKNNRLFFTKSTFFEWCLCKN